MFRPDLRHLPFLLRSPYFYSSAAIGTFFNYNGVRSLQALKKRFNVTIAIWTTQLRNR
jgi:hypothetical protein